MTLFKSHRPKPLPSVRGEVERVVPARRSAPAAEEAAAATTDAVTTGAATSGAAKEAASARPRPKELGGPDGPEPTRYGDWERKGICYDF